MPSPALSHLAASALLVALAAPAQPSPAGTSVEVAGDAAVFRGRIDRRSVDEFLRALQQNPGVTRLVITSGGGQVISALDMADAIHARQLDVEVPSVCLSSCANYVFPAGRRKRLGHPLAVGWHGNMTHVLFLDLTGHGQWTAAEMEGARWLARREAEFFARIGVDGFVCWFAKIAPYDIADYYTLSAGDMARFGITGVDVQQAPDPPPGGSTPEMVTVDFPRLERERPAMPLYP